MAEWISDVLSVFQSSLLCEVQLPCQQWLISDSGHWGFAWAVRELSWGSKALQAGTCMGVTPNLVASAWWLMLEGAHGASDQITDQVSNQTLIEFMSTGQACDQFSLLLTSLDRSLVSSAGNMAPITRSQSPVQCRDLWVMADAWEIQEDE